MQWQWQQWYVVRLYCTSNMVDASWDDGSLLRAYENAVRSFETSEHVASPAAVSGGLPTDVSVLTSGHDCADARRPDIPDCPASDSDPAPSRPEWHRSPPPGMVLWDSHTGKPVPPDQQAVLEHHWTCSGAALPAVGRRDAIPWSLPLIDGARDAMASEGRVLKAQPPCDEPNVAPSRWMPPPWCKEGHTASAGEQPSPPPPPADTDPELANLLMAWYYSGYYMGRYQATRGNCPGS